MTAIQIITKLPTKAPFPDKITVKTITGNVKYSLVLQTRKKSDVSSYVSKYNKKYGEEMIKIKRGVWYLVYAW